MRTNNYLWAVLAAATLSLSACVSGEDAPQATGEKTARLELKIAGTRTPDTKATGDALPTSEDKINRVTVGIFDSSTGETNTIAEPTLDTDKGIYKINCKAGTCDIIVVANAPTGTFKGITNKNDFIARTVELSATAENDVQTATNLPMSGETNDITFVAGEKKTQTIKISRLVSRVSISSIKTAFDPKGQYANATFVAKKVFLHNAKSKSTVTAAAAPTTTVPLSGKTDAENKYLQTTINPQVTFPTAGTHTNRYWFYTFANTDAAKPTKLVIYGSFDADGSGTTASPVDIYYPVVVNKQQTGTTITNTGGTAADQGTATIVRNATYNITATIKSIGVDDPDKDINPATLELTVQVKDWDLVINQDVTFE